jgi:hypothetical protein
VVLCAKSGRNSLRGVAAFFVFQEVMDMQYTVNVWRGIMWNQVWQWAIDNNVYQAIVIIFIVHFTIFPGRLHKMFRGFKKIKAGSIELEGQDQDIDPNTPCPYTKSRDITFSALRGIEQKIDGFEKELKEIMSIVKNMSIDQQKQLFYDKNQPAPERLAGGLKYIYQGGNGHTKPDVIAFAEEHKDVYNALTHVMPDLRLVCENKNEH